ncbi:Fukutin [Armadillidium nasatum]|uniref:Fukutin n=1 Tax=Armadillidium nasatum TaxID=96803 RepID=A0A5N5T6Y4_9CRUS|nr:Fukutin [Armadillidium nasatum]
MILCGHRIKYKQILLIGFIVCISLCILTLYFFLFPTRHFQPYLDVEDVQLLLRAAEANGVSVVLFDPLILHAWSSNEEVVKSGSCLFLCHVVGPLLFSITEKDLKNKGHFLSMLAQQGFTVTQFYADDKESHIFLRRYGPGLVISILYWSNAGYWRQYQLTGPPHHMAMVKQFITHETWGVLNMDRAYERFETNEAVIDEFKLTAPSNIEDFDEDYKNAKFIPCNETQATYFYTKYKEQDNPEVKRFQHLAWKTLAKSKTVLDKIGIPFWLSSGTLLGFFRQCNIIPWAVDVDLGIFIDDYSSEVIPSFEAAGMKLVHKFGQLDDSFELSFKESDIKVDLFFFYTEGGIMWNGGTQVKTGKKFKYVFPRFTLCWTEFLGLKVRIPCQTLDYIEANYGKNWFIPVKNWDWKSSPPNVQENGEWNENERDKVIVLVNEKSQND